VVVLLTVVRVYDRGRKLSEKELRSADGVVGDVRTQTVQINGQEIHQAVCMGGSTESLPPLIEPRFTGMSPLALGLEVTRKRKLPRGSFTTGKDGGAGCARKISLRAVPVGVQTNGSESLVLAISWRNVEAGEAGRMRFAKDVLVRSLSVRGITESGVRQ
jgi:hypothetical protein